MTATRVVIAGGGPGGLEAALALRSLMHDQLELTLVSASPTLAYRPWSVAEPFDAGVAVEIDLARVASLAGFTLRLARILAVDAEQGALETGDGAVPYDALVLALGARQVPTVAGAVAFRGPQDVDGLRRELERVTLTAGARVVFVADASAFWPLPAYELALLTHTWSNQRGTPLRVAVATSESAPLEAFGDDDSRQVAELLAARGVTLHARTVSEVYRDGRLHAADGASIPADLVVALPSLVGPSLPGLPHDAAGFVGVDGFGRVPGAPGVFAIGDMAGHALKQGGLATQQADVAAGAIARDAGIRCESEPYEPVLRAILLTGERPVYLRNPPVRAEEGSPWWPPHKISGRHLAPFLAVHADLLTTATA